MTASVDLALLMDARAFRAIQGGGFALPTAANPVAITDRIVEHGETDYLAHASTEWEKALRALLTGPGRDRRRSSLPLRRALLRPPWQSLAGARRSSISVTDRPQVPSEEVL
jgi:hypothetical protein